tara:strand:+ start:8791 stop:9204 length:414 start_codon:yes stop_codon:yes gene_type:complete
MISSIILLALGSVSQESQIAPPAEKSDAASAPVPLTDPESWIVGYSRHARHLGLEGEVSVRLTINSDGRVVSCSLESSSGHEILDNWTCKQLIRNASFEPASNSGGQHSLRTYPYRHIWTLDQPDAPPGWAYERTPG